MKQKIFTGEIRSARTRAPDELFSGLLINWKSLTQSEKVVALGIAFIPFWWLWGWSYLELFLAIGLLCHDFIYKGEVKVKSVSLPVILLVLYGTYSAITIYFYGLYNPTEAFGVTQLIRTIDSNLAPALILWYIQKNKIRVRLPVVAWAFSIVVFLMLLYWVVILLVYQQAIYSPPRSLFGILTGKPVVFVPGLGNTNYLIPYRALDKSVFSFVRYYFFFHGPESLALAVSFVCLLSLDLKNRVWAYSLFLASAWVLLISGTRSAWIVLSFCLIVRIVVILFKHSQRSLFYSLFTLLSVAVLMFPPVTRLAYNQVAGTAQATGDFRGDSTEVRGEIYRQTLNRVGESTNTQFFLGHIVPGETVLPGYAPAMVGTHSFYLGTLLYRRGLIGTLLFLSFWLSYIYWLRQTRIDRPSCCFLIVLLLTNIFYVMAFESVVMPIIFLVAVLTSNDFVSSSFLDRNSVPSGNTGSHNA